MNDERWFEQLATLTLADAAAQERAPAKIKARVYSAVIERLTASSPLLSLSATKSAGHRLCVFEHALAGLPASERLQQSNPCRICHARVLGERMEHAPIFWPGCPYAAFHRE